MLSKEMKKELLHFTITAVALGIIAGIIIFIFWNGKESLFPMLSGIAYGSLYIILNFILIGISVSIAAAKGENKAKIYISTSYILRMLLLVGVIISAIRLPNIFNVYTVIIPVFFTRIIMLLNTFIFKKRGGDGK